MTVATLLLAAPLAASPSEVELSSRESRGMSIFTNGKASGSPIEAIFAGSQLPVPATAVPCGSCHGTDGRGRAEGGVLPPDIRYSTLIREPAAPTPDGRRRAPYTDRLLKRVIAMGIDSAGNPLNATMPRYRMSAGDMDALVSYLKDLENTTDPGISDSTLRLGVLLPPSDVLSEAGAEVRALLQSWTNEVNRGGGVFGRIIELVFVAPSGTASERAAEARRFITREQPFALVSSFTDGADAELATLAEQQRIPLLATMSAHPQSSIAPNRYLRDLCAGLTEQGRALARFAASRFGTNGRVTVVEPRDERAGAAGPSVVAELRRLGYASVTSVSSATLDGTKTDLMLFLAEPAALAAVVETDWDGLLLLPASLVHPKLLERHRTNARVFLSFPMAPADRDGDALALYRRLAERSGVTPRHQATQFAALASAQLLRSALECAGRDVTREKLLDCVDRTTRLQTGLLPPLSYGSNRHIGSTGSYILGLQADQTPVWIDLD